MAFNETGINLKNWKECIFSGENYSIETFIERVLAQNLRNSIFVDNTASYEVSSRYEHLLQSHISVVTCNKIASSSEYHRYEKLKETARQRNIRFLFESNVGAGLPIINTLNNMRASGDEILSIEGVLSGSINFILNELFAGSTFKISCLKAMQEGYTEPDPRIDLSGKDVARKLLILAREAGYALEMEDIAIKRFLPDEFFEDQPLEQFINQLDNLEDEMKSISEKAKTLNKKIRFVARFDQHSASASLEEVNTESPFYQIDGKDNLIIIRTKWYFNQPLVIKGAGAGAELTASGIMADIIQAGH